MGHGEVKGLAQDRTTVRGEAALCWPVGRPWQGPCSCSGAHVSPQAPAGGALEGADRLSERRGLCWALSRQREGCQRGRQCEQGRRSCWSLVSSSRFAFCLIV